MEGEQLPKATMNTYLKQQTRTPYSNDYLLKMLYIAKGTSPAIYRIHCKDSRQVQCHVLKLSEEDHQYLTSRCCSKGNVPPI